MSNKVLLKKSSVVGKAPTATDLDYGELALNYADGLLYFKNASNNIQTFAAYNSDVVTLTATQTLTNKTLTSPTLNTPNINGGSVSLSNGTLVVPVAASPSQTDTGSIVYDSGFGVLTVGTGAGRKQVVDTSTSQTLTNKTLTAASLGNSVLTGTLSAGGGVGTNNQYLKSTGTGVAWATLPTYTLVAATTSTLGGVIVGSGLSVSAGTVSLDTSIAATLSGTQTLSNKTIDSLTLTGTLTANGSAGTSGYYLQSTATGVQWAAVQQGVPAATRITSNTNAVAGSSYIADTTAGTFTLTLPASPATGDTIIVSDGGTFGTTPLTVARNTKTIEGAAADLSININGVSVTLSYDGTTWQVYTQVGASGGSEVTLAGTQTFTNKTISGASNTLTNIGNSSLTNSSVTVNGSSISLGGSATITAVNPNALTIGTGLSGTSYTGSAGVTIAIDSTVTTLTGTQTLTNKTLTTPTINGAALSGTLSGTPTFSGLVTLNYTGAGSTSTLNLAGYNSKGGTGYHDFLIATNGYGSATNPNKWFRLNSTGNLEIINSAYTASIFNLSDAGDLVISGSLTMANRPAFRVVGGGTTNISATNTLTSSNFTVDYNQGSYLNTSTGIFTAPIAGLYQVGLVARFSGSASVSAIQVQKTSSGTTSTQVYLEWAGNSTSYHMGGSAIVKMAVNDTLKLVVTSGTVTFDSNDQWSVAYIG